MVSEEAGRRQSDGIDILELVAAPNESIEAKPLKDNVFDAKTRHKNRGEKKKLLRRADVPVETDVSIAKCGSLKEQSNTKSSIQVPITAVARSMKSDVGTSLKLEKNDGSVMILKRNDDKGKPAHIPKNKGGKISLLQKELSSLRQELLEVKKRLEQEKIARKLCEANHYKLQCELTSTRQTLEHESQYRKNCQRDMQKLKEELEKELKLRLNAQDVESKFNDLIIAEKEKVRELSKHLQNEKHSKEVIMKNLEQTNAQLLSEQSLRQSIQDNLAAEQKINESLQKKIGIDSASSIAIKMELQSMKLRMGRVDEVEQALKQEILKVDQLRSELARAESFKTELEEAKERLLRMDELKMELLLERSKLQEAEAKLEEQTWCRKRSDSMQIGNDPNTRKQPQSCLKNDDIDDDMDINVEKLRKELYETREALKLERKKNATLTAKKSKAAVSSLKDWIDLALPSTAEVSMPPATQISLSEGTPQRESSEYLKNETTSENESNQVHYFDGVMNKFCGEEETNPLDDELTFIMSAYSTDELTVSETKDKVMYTVDLPTNNDDQVEIIVTVHIPKGYPLKGILRVEIAISDNSNCSSDVRKCVMDALPKLCQMCLWEAEGNYGQEALFSVLNMADNWAKTTWPGILSKQCPSFKILQRPKPVHSDERSTDLCSALIYTHHLIEPEKLQMVKKIASKLSLGGFVKSGKPGVILIASTAEADCDAFIKELSSQASKKVFHSITFKLAGKVPRQALDASSSKIFSSKMTLLDNNKDGMEELIRACDSLGLAKSLEEII
ncbi:hypothetical protein ACHAWX_007184 [Stephanocyclus meneghinianus]